MAEYIERQKLYNNLVLLAKYETEERQQGILGCAETVRLFPSADVAPVEHGRWMHEKTKGGFHSWRCSRCGRGLYVNPEGIDLYCYHCGAKMDGDAE